MIYVPLQTAAVVSTLTPDNLQAIGIKIVAYELDDLLIKPGILVLQKFSSLHDFLGWREQIIVDITLKGGWRNDDYQLISPYDGAKISIERAELQYLIKKLDTDGVINVHESQAHDASSYIYVTYKMLTLWQIPLHAIRVYYLQDDGFLISSAPAYAALHGIVYTDAGVFNILDRQYRQAFISLDTDCHCPTCLDGYTCAYLHHLLQNTPLLAQRLLIMHNVFRFKTELAIY